MWGLASLVVKVTETSDSSSFLHFLKLREQQLIGTSHIFAPINRRVHNLQHSHYALNAIALFGEYTTF